MDLKSIIATISQVFPTLVSLLQLMGVSIPAATLTKFTTLLTALQNSPDLIAFLQSLLAKQGNLPPGTLAEIDPNDPALIAAYEASPDVKAWAETPSTVPAGAEAISLSGLAALLQFLPQLIALFNSFKKPATT